MGENINGGGLTKRKGGFPGGPVVKNALQCKETLVPSLVQEETNAEEQLSPGTSTTEPTHCNEGSWCTQTLYSAREATSVRNPHTNEEQPPLAATRERPRAATRPSRARRKMSRKGDEWNTGGWVRRSLGLPSRSQL